MKKILLLGLLFMVRQGVFAQSAALTVTNNTACTLYISVRAVDANLGNNSGCDIVLCLTVNPTSSVSFIDPSYAMVPGGGPGFCYVTTSFAYPTLLSELAGTLGPPSWAWTDAVFQFACTDCGVGGNLWEPFPGMCTIHCIGSSSSTWTPSTCTSQITIGGTWASPGACLMNDVTITFN